MILVYLGLQLKRTFRHLPLLLSGALLLFILTGSIALLSSEKLYGDAITGSIRIGVVFPEVGVDERLFISALASQETLEEMTEFIETDETKGRYDLEQGALQALILLPEDFISKIRTGVNEPARVILNQNQALEARLFETLAEAGARTLSASQGALYAAWDVFRDQGIAEAELASMNADMNERYLSLSLGRDRSFDLELVRATEDLDSLIYFLSSWMILFLLLLGMLEAFVMRPLPEGLKTKLEIRGLGAGIRTLVDWFRLFLLQLMILGAILGVWTIAAPELKVDWTFRPEYLLSLAVVAAALAAFILFVYTAAEDLLSGMLILFAGSFLMVFLSGGFIPSAFFPGIIRDLQPMIPTTGWIRVMGDVFSGSFQILRYLPVIITAVMFAGLAYWAEIRRSQRRMEQ